MWWRRRGIRRHGGDPISQGLATAPLRREHFVASMVLLAGSGVILAVAKSQPGNVFGGTLTLYLLRLPGSPQEAGEKIEVVGFDSIGRSQRHSQASERYTASKHYAARPVKHTDTGRDRFLSRVDRGNRRYWRRALLMHGGIDGTRRLSRHLWQMLALRFLLPRCPCSSRALIFFRA